MIAVVAVSSLPQHKGTGLLPVVHGLRMLPGGRDMVPEHLRHYLERPVLPSAWYPERDYEILIQVLANLIPPARVGGDVWAYFGKTAAQRDLAGQQDAVAPPARLAQVGAYKRLAQGVGGAVAGLAARTMKLWHLYHDTGVLTVARKPDDPATTMVARLRDFRFPVRGLESLQLAYITEFGRLVGVGLEGCVVRSIFDGDPHCEWEFRVEPTPVNIASLATLALDEPG
jgi:hypothetical protein